MNSDDSKPLYHKSPRNIPYSPQYQPHLPQNFQGNYQRFRKNSEKGYKTQKIRKFARRRKYLKADEQPLSPMNTTQFIMNSQGFINEPCIEDLQNVLEIKNYNFSSNFGSMLGLMNEDCLKRKMSNEIREDDKNKEIEMILKTSRIECDPAIMMDSIEKLAKIIKEKQEKIEELEKNVKEEMRKEESKLHIE